MEATRLVAAAARCDGRGNAQRNWRSARRRRQPDGAMRTPPSGAVATESVLLDRIPLGVLIYRQDALLYANRYFLD